MADGSGGTDLGALTRLVRASQPIAIAIGDVGAAVAVPGRSATVSRAALPQTLRAIESARPRWVWWSNEPASHMLEMGIRVSRCWDLAAVHRLLAGGWVDDPGTVWARAHGLDLERQPTVQPLDLFTPPSEAGESDVAVRADGYLDPRWADGDWSRTVDHTVRWAELALHVYAKQHDMLARLPDSTRPGIPRDPDHPRATALAESAAGLICVELEHDGLPFDRAIGERIVSGFVGPRPRDASDERQQIAALDETVLRHAPSDAVFDLRRPDHVKSMLRRVGVEVPDTRAWRLEALRDAHPLVDALLEWRRAERIRTTFGYPWIDEHVDADGRLRGRWHASDGAAGRMTATAGLHNMPSDMRPAVTPRTGRLLVRADLGQIEPRVLAAVSGDDRLIRAARDDDMYSPVAARLGVDRSTAKVAVLGAMYGQTTGVGAQALRGLEREYPIAMGYLRAADDAAQGGRDLRTYGGRLIRMSGAVSEAMSGSEVRARAAARGRYGRNAMVQGAAAELFKVWAAVVRARIAALDASIVLCLHDELIVESAADVVDDVARMVRDGVNEAAARWSPAMPDVVRFVVDVSVVERWSDAT